MWFIDLKICWKTRRQLLECERKRNSRAAVFLPLDRLLLLLKSSSRKNKHRPPKENEIQQNIDHSLGTCYIFPHIGSVILLRNYQIFSRRKHTHLFASCPFACVSGARFFTLVSLIAFFHYWKLCGKATNPTLFPLTLLDQAHIWLLIASKIFGLCQDATCEWTNNTIKLLSGFADVHQHRTWWYLLHLL